MSLDLSPSIVENRVSEWKSSRLPGAKWPTRLQAAREFRSSSSTERAVTTWIGRKPFHICLPVYISPPSNSVVTVKAMSLVASSRFRTSLPTSYSWPTTSTRSTCFSSGIASGNILLEWSGRDQWDHTHPDDVLYQWRMGDANLCGLCSWAGICGPLCSRLTGMVSSRLFGCAGRFRALLPLFRPFVIQRSRRWLCFSPWPGRGAPCPPQFEGCLGTAPYLRVSANPGTIRPGNPYNHHQL